MYSSSGSPFEAVLHRDEPLVEVPLEADEQQALLELAVLGEAVGEVVARGAGSASPRPRACAGSRGGCARSSGMKSPFGIRLVVRDVVLAAPVERRARRLVPPDDVLLGGERGPVPELDLGPDGAHDHVRAARGPRRLTRNAGRHPDQLVHQLVVRTRQGSRCRP